MANPIASTKERLNPISRDFEKALIAAIENVDKLTNLIEESQKLHEDNTYDLSEIFDEDHEVNKVLLPILNKYITTSGDYIGPRNFAITYKGEPVPCKIVAGDVDGFAWLTGVLKIDHNFGFTGNAQVKMTFGN